MLSIEIVSWDKYNPRSDAKKWSWFRFQNDFFDDDALCDLTGAQKLLLVYLFARRNKAETPTFRVNPRHAAARVDASPQDVVDALHAIEKAGIIKVHVIDIAQTDVRGRTDPYVDVRGRTDPYVHDRIRSLRTDVTDDTDDTDTTFRERDRNETKRNEKNRSASPPRPSPSPSAFDHETAEKWAALARSKSDTAKPDVVTYADAVRRLRTVVGLSEDDVTSTLAWIVASSFWAKVAWSPTRLFSRSEKGGPRKIDTIRAQMADDKPAPKPVGSGYRILTAEMLDEL